MLNDEREKGVAVSDGSKRTREWRNEHRNEPLLLRRETQNLYYWDRKRLKAVLEHVRDSPAAVKERHRLCSTCEEVETAKV